MLIFVNLFGADANETLSLVFAATAPLSEVFDAIHLLRPGVTINRILFAGAQLTDKTKTLMHYRVLKECTIQCQCAAAASGAESFEDSSVVHVEHESHVVMDQGNARSASLDRPASFAAVLPGVSPTLSKAVSEDGIQFGDAVFVTLQSAHNLLGVDWNGLSDPYCVLSMDTAASANTPTEDEPAASQTARSSIIKKSVSPVWNERFAFFISAGTQFAVLHFMVFDHNLVAADEPIGSVSISVSLIPRYEKMTRKLSLCGVSQGEIVVTLNRTCLSSSVQSDLLRKLTVTGGPLTDALAAQHQVSIEQLMGDVPFVVRDEEATSGVGVGGTVNPALANLEARLQADKMKLQASRTLSKVAHVLMAQDAVQTLVRSKPCRLAIILHPFLLILNSGIAPLILALVFQPDRTGRRAFCSCPTFRPQSTEWECTSF
jgi:hypothetical protein